MLGIGVKLGMMGGNKDSVEAFKEAAGKKIVELKLEDEALKLRFEDGTGIKFFDDGQSCCESRYMRTDDDLSKFIGARLQEAEVREVPGKGEEDYGEHDQAFLIVTTDQGSFTMVNHNEHNGYYGGFRIRVSKI